VDSNAAQTAAVPSDQAPIPGEALPPVPSPLADSIAPPPEPALAPALIGITLAGLSLLLSQAPYGRLSGFAVAGIGLALGLASLFMAARRRLVPGLASALNAAVLLVVIAIPSWLGLKSWWPVTSHEDSTVKAVRHNSGGASAPAEWVDASRESWRQADVLVSVRAFTVESVELSGPDGKKMRTKEPYLQIWLRVTNEGVARKIDFTGWDAAEPSTAPRLADAAGYALAPKTFEPGLEPPGRPASATIFPGKWAENLLIFAAPSATAGGLRLELPGRAFGSADTVRLTLPQVRVSPQRSKKLGAITP
jgi:hypothetical protein